MGKIILLCGNDVSSAILYNAIHAHFPIDMVLVEKPVDKWKFIKRRAKKLGWFTAIGQVLFKLIAEPFIRKSSSNRIEELYEKFNFNPSWDAIANCHSVSSINSSTAEHLLKQSKANLILVNGTRIISKKILATTEAVFVNIHAGITPKYRGIHGGYWALVNNDIENAGVTTHLIDAGIDTGGILMQDTFVPEAEDSILSYPLYQLNSGIEHLKELIPQLLKKEYQIKNKAGESKLWYHPTIWGYCYNRWFNGVK